MSFEPVKVRDLSNVFDMMSKQWALICAGSLEKHNAMTAAWAGLGVMWNKEICSIFVRPQRYTNEFLMANDYFTLNFFGEEHRETLNMLGKLSGRDTDKMAKCGLTPMDMGDNTVGFEQAELVLKCKKVFSQDLDISQILDPTDRAFYKDDLHTMYFGHIVQALRK